MKFPSLNLIVSESYSVIKRFPQIIVLIIIEMILCMISIQTNSFNNHTLNNLLAAIWLTIILSTASAFISEGHRLSSKKSLVFNLTAIIIGLLYYFTIPDNWVYPWLEQYSLFCISSGLLTLLAGFKIKEQNVKLVDFYLNLIQKLVLTAFFTMIIYGGLSSAIWSFCKLLGIDSGYKIYSHLFCLTTGMFSPLFFFSGISLDFAKNRQDYPKLFKNLLQYILLPLVAIYLLILYIYLTKILITLSWPKGMVAELILSYASIGIFTFFLLYPLSVFEENIWLNRFTKYFYIALSPLLVMLFLAIELRISEYGITADRYFVVGLAIWLSIVTCYMIFSRKKNLKFMIALLMILTMIAAVGPVNAFDVSRKSQYNRLQKLLNVNKLLQNNKVVKSSQTLSFKDNKSICSILEYLDKSKSLNLLQLNFGFKSVDTVTVQKLLKQLNIRYISQWENENRSGSYLSISPTKNQNFTDLRGFDYIYDLSFNCNDSIKIDSLYLIISVKKEQEKLFVIISKFNNQLAKFNLTETADSLLKISSGYSNGYSYTLPAEKLIYDLENESLKAKFIIKNLNLNLDESSFKVKDINGINAKLLFRLK